MAPIASPVSSQVFGALRSALPGRSLQAIKYHISNCIRSIEATPRSSDKTLSLTKREDKWSNNVQKGTGTMNPYHVNNKGMLWLFALLFGALVITAIWFFFWAKNGGFRFKKGDWEDYKSTVLRRKGPDGKTLSGATRSSKLGQSSIDGDYDVEDLSYEPMGRDADVREYRHEKPARVGGLNRKADGSYYDHTNTDRSTVTFDVPRASVSPPRKEKKEKKSWFSRAKKSSPPKQGREMRQAARQPSAAYSFTTGDDSTVVSDQSSRGERHTHSHRPSAQRPHRPQRSSRHSSPARRSGPQYTYRDRQPSYQPSEASYLYNDGRSEGTGDYGTKSYRHVIPGLSSSGRSEGVNDRRVDRGFRRGGGGRRDSLSDSEGETTR